MSYFSESACATQKKLYDVQANRCAVIIVINRNGAPGLHVSMSHDILRTVRFFRYGVVARFILLLKEKQAVRRFLLFS